MNVALRIARDSWRRLALSAGVAVLQAGLLVVLGLLVRRAFDHAIPSGSVRSLIAIGAALLVVAVASAALALWTRHLVLRAVKDAIGRLRIALLERLNTLPAAWYDRADASLVQSTVVQDSERLDEIANALAALVIPALVIGAGISVALVVINALLFGVLALSLPVTVLLTRLFHRVAQRRTRVWHAAFDRFSARILFAVRARPLITAQAAEDMEVEAGSTEIVGLSEAGRSMAWMFAAYGQLHGAVSIVSSLLVLVVGGASIAHGHMSLGSLISFYALLAILRTQVSAVVGAVPLAISGTESYARLHAILAAPEKQPYAGTRTSRVERALALRDVDFGYVEGTPVLEGMSIELERGRWLTLVGPNGSGKSTIAALLLGLYRPWHGTAEADGVAYDELDVRALRRHIGFVPQRPILFSASIADNIAYGARDVDAGRVREAARLARVDEFAEQLDAGYDSQVGDEGDRLSGGERQRIAIARALLREPVVLILDEPTTSLDRETMDRVLENLRALAYEPAVLVITHDGTLIDDSDRVVDLGALTSARAEA